MSDVLLSVEGLKTYFRTPEGTARAVDDVSFEIRRGETFALVGESGCGKSVTALSIIRLLAEPPGFYAGGSIRYRGTDLLRLPEFEMRRYRGRDVSMIFQEPMTSLNPVFTIGHQISEVFRRHQGLSAWEAAKRSIEMLEMVGIPEPGHRIGDFPHQLSGGMRQRVMIAMALACRPGLLIADEPTTAVDVTIQAQILELMRKLREETGTAILLITHNMAVVAENADRIGVMYAGRIVETADRVKLFQNPAHPYTARLLQSLPSGHKRDEALQTIEGRVPPATQYPPGCRFADRCHKKMAECVRVDPSLQEIEAGHQVACLLYEGPDKSTGRVGEAAEARPRLSLRTGVEPLLQVRGLQVHFPIRRGILQRTVGHVRAVDGVDMDVLRGRTLALVGESGCGKTTLGKAILQLVRPTAGSVTFGGVDLVSIGRGRLKPLRQKLQIIFQDPYSSLNPRMMVSEIIEEGMKSQGIGSSHADRVDRMAQVLGRVGLDPEMMHRYPHEFSGGQRQRIGIARCLSVNPEFIVCDEATSALDVSVQAQILNLLEKLQVDLNLTYLFITHDLSVVEYLADEVAVMYLGRIVERGPTEEIFGSPKHPYTRALLAAIPKVDPTTGVRKIRLSGDVPSPIRPPSGCHFHPRCPEVMDVCSKEYPPESKFSDSHCGRCWLYTSRR
jgi:peptide/nickel transport system ATP-binding protein